MAHKEGDIIEYESGLKAQIIKVGTGEQAIKNSNVKVHYVGTLLNGEKFDSSRDRGKAFNFTVGGGQVIPGWDEGVEGMRIGELRKLEIPPELGYGSNPVGSIPANSTLIFEVELLEIVGSPVQRGAVQ
ncbi:MAG TPA: FKBP-type peptidyl-prolyl cis-trans isomerase [Candidatus Gracilibacteria bacterium]